MNHDSLIDKIFFKENILYKPNIVKFNINKKNKYYNIKNYLDNRYNDSENNRETLYRIHYNIENKPTCKICGKKLKFRGKSNILYPIYCSNKCKGLDKDFHNKIYNTCIQKYKLGNLTNREKYKNTCILKYGVENTYQIPEVIKKIKKINKDKNYGLEKQKITNNKKYNNDYYLQTKEFKIKSEATCLLKYGASNYAKSNEGKIKLSKILSSDEIQTKRYNTFKKNNSFNKSKEELFCYKLLKEKYPDIIRQYHSEIYPFSCDFYIPSLDLYIEYQGSDLHGFHPFDETNKDDILRLNDLKERSKKLKEQDKRVKNRYDYSIYTWTDLDIRKRNIAKQNNLNWLEFFSIQELKDWLEKQ